MIMCDGPALVCLSLRCSSERKHLKTDVETVNSSFSQLKNEFQVDVVILLLLCV